ncbi:MAG TPA: YciI family protein [Acidimicrobiales bacterium]|nr:YciI family protein [Acidimicrobiales bacterium]
MTEYLLSVWIDESAEPPAADVIEKAYKDVDALNQQIKDAGAWVFAGGLHPTSAATVVKARDGEVLTTDGPFAETKEQLGGFWVIDVPDLDAALAWASKATVACLGPVEVRPFQGEDGPPA